ncbi:hypothetical protein KUV50_18885 [Membranicola marinus]|uniref:LVIVD repeat-containing protein n=1 Tax=Membranihabitans marinus TaxID=1227546 RepID=A0A953LEQ1_9BACT|nr:hypothetical protein [Membranihabitans marinus]MBY5960224.1 hypothetical protein [Membranihabitans marinus]
MKTINYLLITITGLFFAGSCVKDKCTQTKEFTHYAPVYITQAEYDAPVEYESVRPMENTGTIFAYGDYIFVNEFQKGIHIVDNQEPAHPKPLGFIDIPGNTHFTIRQDVLYANKMEDLVAIDVSHVEQPQQVNRLKGVFQLNRAQTSSEGIVAYYENTHEVVELDCNDYRYSSVMFAFEDGVFVDQGGFNSRMDYAFATPNLSAAAESSSKAPGTLGVGGSMARFTTIQDRLYILSDFLLETVDISTAKKPAKMGNIPIRFTAETIYPFGSHLYIGTTNGMHIYSVSDAGLPEHVSTTAHIQSCDPVISDGSYAYVTLRGGTPCGGTTNQLEAYDVEDPFNPALLQTFPMENPHGLTKVGDFLYVCEGNGGWKKIKSNLPGPFSTTLTNTNHSAFDVLLTPRGTLLFVGKSGIYQYSLEGKNPNLISKLEITLP